MKITSRLAGGLVVIAAALGLQGCPSDMVNNNPASFAHGIWEWDSTTTPSHVLTPASVGYTQQLNLRRNGYHDPTAASISFYRNDTLQRRFLEPDGDSAEVIELDNKNALIRYRSPMPNSPSATAYIHYRIEATNKAESLIVSEFLNPYSEKADTVHHYFRAMLPYTNLYPSN